MELQIAVLGDRARRFAQPLVDARLPGEGVFATIPGAV